MDEFEKQNKDCERILKMLKHVPLRSFAEAEQMVTSLFVPDLSYSRAGISLALRKLESEFKQDA